jgi:hypothetical protein
MLFRTSLIQQAIIEQIGNARGMNIRPLMSGDNLNADGHLHRLANVQSSLRSFEAQLEDTRSAVLNSTRRLKLEEVDELAGRLAEIGRETVELKGWQIE